MGLHGTGERAVRWSPKGVYKTYQPLVNSDVINQGSPQAFKGNSGVWSRFEPLLKKVDTDMSP